MVVRRACLGLASLAALATAACSRQGGPRSGPLIVREPVDLTIDNRSASDLTVFVYHDGRTDRLDRIEGVRKKRIAIPLRMIGVSGELRLIGEREGAHAGFAGRIATQTVSLHTCQRLEWTIEARLEHSTLGVYPSDSCQ
ncbi:MAG TPA: hypothetical protein VE967_15585 [Gemmatimonadaceae bacterium]|nr:hypothetical protein [Gemmatimonadaceae bacterium]